MSRCSGPTLHMVKIFQDTISDLEGYWSIDVTLFDKNFAVRGTTKQTVSEPRTSGSVINFYDIPSMNVEPKGWRRSEQGIWEMRLLKGAVPLFYSNGIWDGGKVEVVFDNPYTVKLA